MKVNFLCVPYACCMLALSALLALPCSAHAANSTISTMSSWNGSDSVSGFGSYFTPTYGETFQASTTDTILNSITFQIQDTSGPINFHASVYAWDGAKITGSSLFTSTSQVIPNTGGSFLAVSINTGSIVLTPSAAYVAVFSTLGEVKTTNYAFYGSAASSPVTDSKFVYNNGTTQASLSTATWNNYGDAGQLAFTFGFTGAPAAPAVTAVPDTGSTLALLALGAAALALVRRRLLA